MRQGILCRRNKTVAVYCELEVPERAVISNWTRWDGLAEAWNPMNVLELNHVAIHVTDVGRSVEFYRRVLRLEPIPRPAFDFPGAWFRLGASQELHLIANHGAPFSPNNRNNHFALRVDDLDEWERHLESVSANFARRKRRPDGAWQVFLQDPDGQTVELFTPKE